MEGSDVTQGKIDPRTPSCVRYPKIKNPAQNPRHLIELNKFPRIGNFTNVHLLGLSNIDPFTIPEVIVHPINNKNSISILIKII